MVLMIIFWSVVCKQVPNLLYDLWDPKWFKFAIKIESYWKSLKIKTISCLKKKKEFRTPIGKRWGDNLLAQEPETSSCARSKAFRPHWAPSFCFPSFLCFLGHSQGFCSSVQAEGGRDGGWGGTHCWQCPGTHAVPATWAPCLQASSPTQAFLSLSMK